MNELKRNFFYSKSASAKTVRKNCFWVEVNGNKYLVSYQTIVCCISASGYFHRFWDDYSVTTLNQIRQFISLFEVFNNVTGEKLTGFNKKEWLDYPVERPIEDDEKQIVPLIPAIEWTNYGYSGYDYAKRIIYS